MGIDSVADQAPEPSRIMNHLVGNIQNHSPPQKKVPSAVENGHGNSCTIMGHSKMLNYQRMILSVALSLVFHNLALAAHLEIIGGTGWS